MSFDAFSSTPAGPSSSPEATPTAAPESTPQAAPSTPAPIAKPAMGVPFTPSTTAAPDAMPAGTPEWKPNFKFKVMDVDHEMDPYFQNLVKTESDEKKIREMYEKAVGLDVVKPKYQTTKAELEKVKPQLDSLIGQIGELRNFYEKSDFDNFFKRLQIPEEKVLQWVINKAKYNELPPEQRKAFDDSRSANDTVYKLEKRIQEMEQTYGDQVHQAKSHGLQIALAKPDVTQLAQAFDAKKGTPGSFREEVIKYADYVYVSSQGKTDLTPDQAVQAVVERLTMFGGIPQSQPQIVPAQGGPSGQSAPAQKPIPNLAGRSSTPVGKPKPKSLADLRKIAESFNN